MKNGMMAALGALLAMVFVAAAWGQSSPPDGSYRRTCPTYRMLGHMLFADCLDSRGVSFSTAINPANCGGRDIANINGRLNCAPPPSPPTNTPIPMGSYRAACSEISAVGSMLSATCVNARGERVRSALDLASCGDRDILNVDGRLFCEG